MSDYLEIARQVLREGAETPKPGSADALESVLKGKAIELYLKDGDRLFIVADEEDARLVGESRGAIYTASEARRVVQVMDPIAVAEVHLWKREFNARVRDFQRAADAKHQGHEPVC
jgi:hypothetical protein